MFLYASIQVGIDCKVVCFLVSKLMELFSSVTGWSDETLPTQLNLTASQLQVGHVKLPRGGASSTDHGHLCVLHSQLEPLQSIAECVSHNWPVVMVCSFILLSFTNARALIVALLHPLPP